MSVSSCCVTGFEWEGTPVGRIDKLAQNDTYIAGDNPDIAVLLVHDLLGWSFPNVRLLADHYAREANVTVYIPDFFGGEALPFEPIINERWHEFDLMGYMTKSARELREPEIFECAQALRAKYKKLGARGLLLRGLGVLAPGCKGAQAAARGLHCNRTPESFDKEGYRRTRCAHPNLGSRERSGIHG
jgi:hypothetical protein